MCGVDSFGTIHLLLVAVASEDRVTKQLRWSSLYATEHQLIFLPDWSTLKGKVDEKEYYPFIFIRISLFHFALLC